jgi:peptidoglycan/xylan/chitin deacetylase (PgdA/CDA1 family)
LLGTTARDLVLTGDGGGPTDAALLAGNTHALFLEGRDDGTFDPPRTESVSDAGSIAVGNLKGDGANEVVISSTSGLLSVATGTSSPTPADQTTPPIETMTIADVDGDDLDEIVLSHPDGLGMTVVDGTSTFLSPGAAGTLVDSGDFDGDGREELVVATEGSLSLLSFDDSLLAGEPLHFGAGHLAVSGHLDTDDSLDLAVATAYGVEVLLGNGDRTFTAASTISLRGTIADLEIGDVDGDGDNDLINVSQDRVWFHLGTGDGTFEGPVRTYGTDRNTNVELADLNEDGASDVITLEEDGRRLTVLRGNRAPELEPLPAVEAVEGKPLSLDLSAHDADHDGVTYKLAEGPEGAQLDASTGHFEWTPDSPGMQSVRFTVSDWKSSSSRSVEITVARKELLGEVELVAGKDKLVTKKQTLRATVSGDVEHVSFSWAHPGVDGWHQIGDDHSASDGWSADWDTGDRNGHFRIRATAHLENETKSDTGSLVVDNRSPAVRLGNAGAFSPNGDGTRDRLWVTAHSDEPSRIEVTVRREGRIVRQWRSKPGARTIEARWDGRYKGRRVADASYSVHAKAVDGVGRMGFDSGRALVDTQAPGFRWKRVPHHLLTQAGRLSFRYRVNDPSGMPRVKLEVLQRRTPVVQQTLKTKGAGKWSTPSRYADGARLTPGRYGITATVSDPLGNTRRVRPRNWQYAPPVQAKVFHRVENTGRKIALTFDDCNYEASWNSILNTLKAHGVKATFFCGGSLVRRFPRMARRVVKEGHDPASHGGDHLAMPSLSYPAARSQILSDRTAWLSVTGDAAVPYFRPPYGSYNSATVSVAGSLGFSRVMIWDVDTNDWQGRSPGQIMSHVLGSARSGSVVLMHVLPNTAAALPTMLKGLKARGLEPVTLGDLFRAGGQH